MMTAAEKRARTVPPRLGKAAAKEALRRATRRVSARVSIDFVRDVRGRPER